MDREAFSGQPLDVGLGLVAEAVYRGRQSHLAKGDLPAATATMIATGALEPAQTQYEMDLAETAQYNLPAGWESHNILSDTLAIIPFDLKAFAVAAGVYAATSAAYRFRKGLAYTRDTKRLLDAIAQADGFIPQSERIGRLSRLGRTAGRLAITAAATTSAYLAAKHGTLEQDAYVASGLGLMAWGTVGISRLRSWLEIRRARREGNRAYLALDQIRRAYER